MEIEGGEDEKVFCKDCRKAGFTNEFAVGKPGRGWKKEYLQRHVISNDHSKHAALTITTAARASDMFIEQGSKKCAASEKETLGLLLNVHYLVKSGLSLNKVASLHCLVDDQFHFYNEESQSPISQCHRSSYSTWEFVHSLNFVVEQDDFAQLNEARFFLC